MASRLVTTPVDCPICGRPAVLTVDEFWSFGVGVTRRVVNFYECPSGCKPDPSLLL
jgi:hypothetical protein